MKENHPDIYWLIIGLDAFLMLISFLGCLYANLFFALGIAIFGYDMLYMLTKNKLSLLGETARNIIGLLP